MATEDSPVELDPELNDALTATVTRDAPAPADDYWSKIDASLERVETENSFDVDLTKKAHSTSEPAVATSAKSSKGGLKKSMLTAAASIVLLGGGLFVYNNIDSADITSAAESADESFEEVGDNMIFEEIASDAQDRAAGSSDDAAAAAESDSFMADESAEEGDLTAADEDSNLLEDADWFNAKSASKTLVISESFDPSVRVNSASGLILSNEFYVYSFVAEDNDELRVILSSAGLEVTFTLYSEDGEVLAEEVPLIELDSVEAGTYSVLVESTGEEELEFEVSFQLTEG